MRKAAFGLNLKWTQFEKARVWKKCVYSGLVFNFYGEFKIPW